MTWREIPVGEQRSTSQRIRTRICLAIHRQRAFDVVNRNHGNFGWNTRGTYGCIAMPMASPPCSAFTTDPFGIETV